MESIAALTLLSFIAVIAVLLILRANKIKHSEDKTRHIPIFLASIFGFILGGSVGVIFSQYILPSNWWYESDLSRHFELGFIGSFLGIVVGALLAVLRYGGKHRASNN